MFMRYLFLSVILSFILFSGCRGKKDFITYVKGKKVIRKTIVKNYPDSRYPKTMFGFKSYNMIRKNYLITIPESLRAYGLENGDTVLIIDHIKFRIQSNRYNFYLVKKNGKYVYVNGRCIE